MSKLQKQVNILDNGFHTSKKENYWGSKYLVQNFRECIRESQRLGFSVKYYIDHKVNSYPELDTKCKEYLLTQLTVNFGSTTQTLGNALLSLGNSSALKPWEREGYRKPWNLIPDKHFKGMNFFVTINPDSNCDWYTHDVDRKTIVSRFLNAIQHLKNNLIILKSISVYEYGRYGKKHGKLHFHCII